MEWSYYVPSIVVRIEIEVLSCTILELVDPADQPTVSPLYFIFELPHSEVIELPKFEPVPHCGLSNSDLDYEILDSDGMPDWLIFKPEERMVEL